MNEERALTVREAAERLGVSVWFCYAAIQRGELACRRIGIDGRLIRIEPDDLDAYLRAARVAQPRAVQRRTRPVRIRAH